MPMSRTVTLCLLTLTLGVALACGDSGPRDPYAKPEPMAAYNQEVQDAIAGVPVWQESCNGYYRSPTGRIVTQWPFSMSELKERASRLDEESFEAAPKGA